MRYDLRVRFLAISGSLRAASSNTALIAALADLAPPGVAIDVYRRLADLPHFNPDVDEAGAPPPVLHLRTCLRACDGLVISSPEYAHGVSGSLKNALDWVVASGELRQKAVAIMNVSPRATHAQASLVEILTTMDARVIAEASIPVPLLGRKLDAAGILADPELASAVRGALEALAGAAAAAAAAAAASER
jgi:chromate reductase, NAD(P)H dehydrogenase (quinone)